MVKCDSPENSRTEKKGSAVFVCATVYHLLIALVKILTGKETDSDIVILDTMPKAYQLKKAVLERFSCGVSVLPIKQFEEKWHPYELLFFHMYFFRKNYHDFFRQITSYERIYLFHDKDVCGWYLSINKIGYHLLEDGLDCYKVFNQYQLLGHARLLRMLAGWIFRFPVFFGWSKLCIDIEVNDGKDMRTSLRRPIKTVSRKDLFARLKKEDISLLIEIFNSRPLDEINGGVLILTQPLIELGVVKDEEMQISYYNKLAAKFDQQVCYIKPHPRDNCRYDAVFNPSLIIDKYFPVELLNYSDSFFDVGVTYSSTALNSLTFVGKKYACDSSIVNKEIELLQDQV